MNKTSQLNTDVYHRWRVIFLYMNWSDWCWKLVRVYIIWSLYYKFSSSRIKIISLSPISPLLRHKLFLQTFESSYFAETLVTWCVRFMDKRPGNNDRTLHEYYQTSWSYSLHFHLDVTTHSMHHLKKRIQNKTKNNSLTSGMYTCTYTSIYIDLSITTANNLMRKKESTPWTISRTDYAIGEGQSTTLSPGITNVQYISS